MANILSWLFLGGSAAVSGLASADLLLLDSQKKWINDRAADFWNWLDDQRELKYLRYLRGFRWQRFVVILYALIASIVAVGIGVLIYIWECLMSRRLKPRHREIFSTFFWAHTRGAS